ncbi:tyrosine-type recombinase/integrase [Sphingomonas sp. DC2300-3]
MAIDLSRVKEQDALRAQREPFWQRIQPGCFLGYRPSARESAGTWIARAYDEGQRRYHLKALGDFGTLPGRDRFADAKKAAEAFAMLVESGGRPAERIDTVEDACRRYLETHPDVVGRVTCGIFSDPIASVKLTKLRRSHLQAWRQRPQQKPALVTRRKKGPQVTRPRAPSSINRELATLRAALNKVLAPGTPGTEAAWQEALRAIRNADRQRTLYLDRNQRRLPLQKIDPEAEPFVRTLCLLPLRPGAVARLTVADFDARTSELSIGHDKSGKPRRLPIPSKAAELLGARAEGRSPTAPFLARANDKPWAKETRKRPIADAVAAAKLPVGTTAYTLRHSTITDLVDARSPLLSVAQINGTNAEMIERHYGHLSRTETVEALSKLAL